MIPNNNGMIQNQHVFMHHMIISNISSFMQLGLNMSNGVTDTLESSSILIYLIQFKGI